MRPLKRDEGALTIGAFSDQRRCQAARSRLSGELVDVPTTILQELVGGAIASHADPDQTHVLEVAELEERRGIERLADVWGMTFAPYSERLTVARILVAARGRLRDRAPVWLRDQVDAAGREQGQHVTEVGALLSLIEPERHWRQNSAADLENLGFDRAARLYAACLGCTPCIHVRRHGPQPCWADLNHAFVCCRRCTGTWRTPIDDNRCEVCGEPAGPSFTQFLIQLGYIAIGGNAGDCCVPFVVPEVAT